MKKFVSLIALAALPLTLFSTAVVATPANAANECGSAGCSVTFEYTGGMQSWSVPTGLTSVRFEIYGAAGGGGALGGAISGTLHNLPAKLYIAVGGAGSLGSDVAGGYNGGASSGRSRGDSGSGGGASDIRESTSWATRIAIAGGGGGQGSGGALGGSGGGLQGTVGEPGTKLSGGQPGTQTAGGLEGDPNLGSGGVPGGSYNGGVGGSGNGFTPQIGGGGGGGGYFGGGGGVGGGDSDTIGSGGGGGSGYARPSVTSNVQHTVGVRSGNGLVVLRYGATPTLSSFDGAQTGANSAEFTVDFGAPVSGLSTTDFAINVTSGCRIDGLSGGPDRYTVAVSACVASPARLTLAANAATVDEPGPVAAQTAELALSIGEPQFSLTGNPTSSTGDFNFDVQHGAKVQPLGLSDFEVSGCSPSVKAVSTGTRLEFRNCPDGTVRITLKANALRDAFGNSGPSADITRTVRVDGSRPTIRLQLLAPTFDSEGYEQVRVKLIASEPISVRFDSLSVSPAQGCKLSSSGSGSERIFTIKSCQSGNYLLVLPIGAVVDQSGWTAPTSKLNWPFEVVGGKDNSASPTPAPTTDGAAGGGSATTWPTPPPQIAPWIPIDMTTDSEMQDPALTPSSPIAIPDGAAGQSSAEADLSMWLVPAGLSLLFLLIALILLRRRKRDESAEDDGAASVKKHSVFGKPADSLS